MPEAVSLVERIKAPKKGKKMKLRVLYDGGGSYAAAKSDVKVVKLKK